MGAVGASSPPRWLGKMLRAVVGAGIAPRLSVVGSTADLPEPPDCPNIGSPWSLPTISVNDRKPAAMSSPIADIFNMTASEWRRVCSNSSSTWPKRASCTARALLSDSISSRNAAVALWSTDGEAFMCGALLFAGCFHALRCDDGGAPLSVLGALAGAVGRLLSADGSTMRHKQWFTMTLPSPSTIAFRPSVGSVT